MVQTVYGLHGIALPRDSDQQAGLGESVADDGDLSSLDPGDLVYFAERGDRITHVAISAGGAAIIHSALSRGGVTETNLASTDDYEQELRSCFVGARRVIPWV
jgi:cell wall-associated NlpC family hydrolase